ncbi:MAG TPA: trypsin-like peptidase domain-containing protein [Chitinophagaceae bacterium]
MFVNAIEEVGKFTRPIHTITRNYKETLVNPGAATLFFVNEEGCAITCKHVIDLVGNRQAINDQYAKFKEEKSKIGKNNNYNQRIKALEEAYKYKADSLIQLKEFFVGVSTDPTLTYRWISHPRHDLSIIVFENFKNPAYQSCARFIKDSTALKQGKYLCRLGFPFPEFTNFQYNATNDDIEWTNTGKIETPRFPIEGMLTRHIMKDNEIAGIELSTPGLRGQSGGPLFDQQGIVCGMQSGTNHLHLGFDMKNAEIKINDRFIKVNNQPFLNVGHCVHVDIIKNFLKENNIRFYEE